MPDIENKIEFLHRCIQKRCSMNLTNYVSELKTKELNTKYDCLCAIKIQRRIFALKMMMEMDWEDCLQNIEQFRFIFDKTFEYKMIKENFEIGDNFDENIKEYLSQPKKDLVERLYMFVKNKGDDTIL